MDEELIRHMQNWARRYPGLSLDELAKLYYNQNKQLYPGKPRSHDELRQFYLGENPATRRNTWTPAYDEQPQKYPNFPQKHNAPAKSVMDMLADQLGKPKVPGVETGEKLPSIDPRIARKFVM